MLQCACAAGLGGAGLGYAPGSDASKCMSCYGPGSHVISLPEIIEDFLEFEFYLMHQMGLMDYIMHDPATGTAKSKT